LSDTPVKYIVRNKPNRSNRGPLKERKILARKSGVWGSSKQMNLAPICSKTNFPVVLKELGCGGLTRVCAGFTTKRRSLRSDKHSFYSGWPPHAVPANGHRPEGRGRGRCSEGAPLKVQTGRKRMRTARVSVRGRLRSG